MNRGIVSTGDGCRLSYQCDGPADAPVLLLSNSLGTDMRMWAPQIESFTKSFRVLRYDSRGHGASDSPGGAYSIDRLGRDVVELLEALGVEQFDFCGLSLGGMVGQWLGVRAGARLRRLVLANTAAFMGPPSGWQTRIATVRAHGMAPVADASIARWFTQGFAAVMPEAVEQVRAMLLATDPNGYAGCCAAIRDMDQRATTRLIAAPVLVITGAADPAVAADGGWELADGVQNGRLVELAAAHLSNVEQPDGFARAAMDFLMR